MNGQDRRSDPARPVSAAAETAIQRMVMVALPLWLLSTASVAFAPGSSWPPLLILSCLAVTTCAYVSFLFTRTPPVLLSVLVGAGLTLALSAPVSPDLAGGSVVATWASLTSLCMGALIPGRSGLIAAVAGGAGLLAAARARHAILGSPGIPGRWLEVATFAVFAGLLAAAVVGVLRRTAADADDVGVLRARAAAATARDRAGQAEARRVTRMLHDTVVNTLGAVSRWSPTSNEAIAARARVDLDLLRTVESSGLGDPRALLDSVSRRAALLDVALEITIGELGPGLDPPVVAALEGAAWEALNNVAKHSGVSAATLAWTWDGATGQMTIADNGAGFAAHSGWTGGARESVARRSAEAGVHADVTSQPGAGTTVSLRWTATPEHPQAPDPEPLAHPLLVREELDQVMAATVLRICAVVGGIGLISTILMPADLPRWGSVAALAIIATVAAVAGRMRSGGKLPGLPVILWPVATIAATVLPALGRLHSPSGGLWWWGPPACLGVAISSFLIDRRRGVAPLAVLGCVVGITLGAARIGAAVGSTRPDQISILILDLGAIAALLAYRRKLTSAWVAGRQEQDRMEVELAEAARIAEEARIRGQLLTAAGDLAEPLLAGLADGGLDPVDPGVRQRCGQVESTLRTLSAIPTFQPGGVGQVLADSVLAAGRQGIDLTLNLGPEAMLPPPQASNELRQLLVAVIAGCPAGGSAQVTVLRRGSETHLLVLTDTCDAAVAGELQRAVATDGDVRWAVVATGDQVLCEAAWPVADGALDSSSEAITVA